MDFLEYVMDMLFPIQYEFNSYDIDWTLTTISCLLDIGLLLLVIYVVISTIDEINHLKGIKCGFVIKKSFTPAHTTTSLMPCGKGFVPITNHYDDEYVLYIQYEGKSNYWNVDEPTYKHIEEGQTFDYDKYIAN
jgi:hypothetical protein